MKNQRNRDSLRGKQASPPIEGELKSWFETGLEGVVWALMDDVNKGYDRLHVRAVQPVPIRNGEREVTVATVGSDYSAPNFMEFYL